MPPFFLRPESKKGEATREQLLDAARAKRNARKSAKRDIDSARAIQRTWRGHASRKGALQEVCGSSLLGSEDAHQLLCYDSVH